MQRVHAQLVPIPAWDNSDLPDRYGWTLADYPQDVGERVMEFLDSDQPQKWSLSLLGVPGTRKTSLACAIVREFRKRFTPPYDGALAASFFTSKKCSELIRKVPREGWFFERCQKTKLLVLDDIGRLKNTEYLVEQLGSIIMGRYDDVAKTIITGNLTLEDIARELDPRIADRLGEGVTFNCGSESKRVSGNEPITPPEPIQPPQDDTENKS